MDGGESSERHARWMPRQSSSAVSALRPAPVLAHRAELTARASRILSKLGVTNRGEAAAYAARTQGVKTAG